MGLGHFGGSGRGHRSDRVCVSAAAICMKPLLLRLTLTLCLTGIPWPAASSDTTVVILRHGEKPDRGLGQLTCQGLNRALALPRVLLTRYGKPAAIHAPNPAMLKEDMGIPYAYVRPLATIEPLAIQTGMPVNVSLGMREIEPLVAMILAAPGGLHMVAWEHHLGVELAKLLLSKTGGNPADVPRWDDDDFDSLYVIRLAAGATFTREQQGLNGMPLTCPDSG